MPQDQGFDPSQTETSPHQQSYAQVFRELGSSTKDVIESEIALIKAELQEATSELAKDLFKVVLSVSLIALSLLPFLAFLVIGLGLLLDERYWLSSLIVGVISAGLGVAMLMFLFQKMKEFEFIPRSKRVLKRELRIAKNQVREIKDAMKGARHDSKQFY